LLEAKVDDLHARFDQGPGDDLRAPVVAVEARLAMMTLIFAPPWRYPLSWIVNKRLFRYFPKTAVSASLILSERRVPRAHSSSEGIRFRSEPLRF